MTTVAYLISVWKQKGTPEITNQRVIVLAFRINVWQFRIYTVELSRVAKFVARSDKQTYSTYEECVICRRPPRIQTFISLFL